MKKSNKYKNEIIKIILSVKSIEKQYDIFI